MDWNVVEAIAESAGVLLLVVSLLFVGFQVRQNTQQIRQDNLVKSVRGTLDANWYYHRDPEAFRIFRAGCASFNGLVPLDRGHFHSILMDISFYLTVVVQMSKAGLVDRSAAEVNGRFFLAVLDTPGGREWWEFVCETRPMPDSAIADIQAMLDHPGRDRTPITQLQPWFSAAES